MTEKKPRKAKASKAAADTEVQTSTPQSEQQPSTNNPEANQKVATFGLQRIFIVESGFNILDVPQIFKRAWNPNLSVTLDTQAEHLEGKFYLSKTHIGIKGTLEENEAFNLELRMGGIFEIDGIEGDLLERTLYIVCPSIVFPYMREHIDSLMTKASFPPLMLAPIDFESLYRQNQEKRKNTTLAEPGDYRPKMPS